MSKQNNNRVSRTIQEFVASEGRCMELDLSNQVIDWDPTLCSILVETFKISKLLQRVNFYGTHMSSDVLNIIVKGLICCQRLVTLDLSNNNIDDTGAVAIAQLINSNGKRMSLLALHVNEISDVGSEVISTAVLGSEYSGNMKITLHNNKLTETGVVTIQELLGSICNIEIHPQKSLESDDIIERSVSRTSVLIVSPKKASVEDNEEKLEIKIEEVIPKRVEKTKLMLEEGGEDKIFTQSSITSPLLFHAHNSHYDSIDNKPVVEKPDTELVGDSSNCCPCCTIC